MGIIINKDFMNCLKEFMKEENVKENFLLKKKTYIKLGGKADVFVLPTTIKEIQKIVKLCNQSKVPYFILGNGSNLIIKDGGIRGVVISLAKMQGISISDETIYVYAGANLMKLSKTVMQKGLSGLEFACGIPGSVGGAIYMNAGAYGGEIKDVLEEIIVVNEWGELLTKTKEELELGYRYSKIQDTKDIIVLAKFKLKKDCLENIKIKMAELTERRKQTQPLEYPSCGSVFKRPTNEFVGPLIIKCGLQGKRIGDAEVSKKHAGFIVNLGNASSRDYLNLISLIQNEVKKKTNISLSLEVKIIGEDN